MPSNHRPCLFKSAFKAVAPLLLGGFLALGLNCTLASPSEAIKGVVKAPKNGKTVQQPTKQAINAPIFGQSVNQISKPILNHPLTENEKRIEKLETVVFLQTYPEESEASRLNRLETEVFSTMDTQKPVKDRLSHLESVVVIPVQPKPNNSPNDDDDSYAAPPNQQVSQSSVEPSLEGTPQQQASYQGNNPSPNAYVQPANTPATQRLDQLELYLFNRTYPKDTVISRINRLEAQVNQNSTAKSGKTAKTTTKGSIDSRIKALSTTIMGDNAQAVNKPLPQNDVTSDNPGVDPYGNPYNQPSSPQPVYNSRNLYLPSPNDYNVNGGYNQPPPLNTAPLGQQGDNSLPMSYPDPDGGSYTSNAPSNHPSSNGQMNQSTTSPATQADMDVAIGNLEKELFKKNYAQEPANSRLDRLETKVFKQTSPDMPNEDRLERLLAVVAADGDNPRSSMQGGSWHALIPFLIMIPLMLL